MSAFQGRHSCGPGGLTGDYIALTGRFCSGVILPRQRTPKIKMASHRG